MTTAGTLMDWFTNDRVFWNWGRPTASTVAFWVWVPLVALTLFIPGVMIAAARHRYVPRGMTLGAAICASIGVVAAALTVVSAREAVAGTGASMTSALWLLVIGFAISSAAATALWRTAVAAARRSEDELARANRDLAARDGSL